MSLLLVVGVALSSATRGKEWKEKKATCSCPQYIWVGADLLVCKQALRWLTGAFEVVKQVVPFFLRRNTYIAKY